jgi:hypothetical protein
VNAKARLQNDKGRVNTVQLGMCSAALGFCSGTLRKYVFTTPQVLRAGGGWGKENHNHYHHCKEAEPLSLYKEKGSSKSYRKSHACSLDIKDKIPLLKVLFSDSKRGRD